MGRLDSEEVVQVGMKCPMHLWDAWGAIRRRIHTPDRVVLLVDFDGTLARIRRHPQHARLADEVRGLLAAIADRGVLVGVVSGRSLEDIRERVGLPGIWYVGTHGFSLHPPDGYCHVLPKNWRGNGERPGAVLDRFDHFSPIPRVHPRGGNPGFRGSLPS